MPMITSSELQQVRLEDVKAYEVDLNNDKQKEVIGVIYSPLTMGKLGYELFILEKYGKNKYKNIAWSLVFAPYEKVYILTTKHNGYKNIIFRSSKFLGSKMYMTEYENEMYYNDFLFSVYMFFATRP